MPTLENRKEHCNLDLSLILFIFYNRKSAPAAADTDGGGDNDVEIKDPSFRLGLKQTRSVFIIIFIIN